MAQHTRRIDSYIIWHTDRDTNPSINRICIFRNFAHCHPLQPTHHTHRHTHVYLSLMDHTKAPPANDEQQQQQNQQEKQTEQQMRKRSPLSAKWLSYDLTCPLCIVSCTTVLCISSESETVNVCVRGQVDSLIFNGQPNQLYFTVFTYRWQLICSVIDWYLWCAPDILAGSDCARLVLSSLTLVLTACFRSLLCTLLLLSLSLNITWWIHGEQIITMVFYEDTIRELKGMHCLAVVWTYQAAARRRVSLYNRERERKKAPRGVHNIFALRSMEKSNIINSLFIIFYIYTSIE